MTTEWIDRFLFRSTLVERDVNGDGRDKNALKNKEHSITDNVASCIKQESISDHHHDPNVPLNLVKGESKFPCFSQCSPDCNYVNGIEHLGQGVESTEVRDKKGEHSSNSRCSEGITNSLNDNDIFPVFLVKKEPADVKTESENDNVTDALSEAFAGKSDEEAILQHGNVNHIKLEKATNSRLHKEITSDSLQEEPDGWYQSDDPEGIEPQSSPGDDAGNESAERVYSCTQCEKRFAKKQDLVLHARSHPEECPYPCSFCERRFRQPSHLRFHMTVHTGTKLSSPLRRDEKPHQCDQCDMRFAQQRDLRVHKRVHSGEKPYSCTECGKRFRQRAHLQTHMVTHTGAKDYKCPVCDKDFGFRASWRKHLKGHSKEKHEKPLSHEASTESKLESGEVDRPQEESNDYQQSDKPGATIPQSSPAADAEKESPGKMHTCTYCGKKFAKKRDMVVHVRSHTDERPYACSFCDKRFRQNSHLKAHTAIHTGVKPPYLQRQREKKPHQCDQCDMRCSQLRDLRVHMRIHSGEKPFACTECGKRFRQRAHLHSHMVMHTGAKDYQCHLCHKKFGYKGSLRKHLMGHSEEKPFSCEICEKAFRYKSDLKSHQLVHTDPDEKNFACSACGKKFKHPDSVYKHKKKHCEGSLEARLAKEQLKTFVCEICDKRFPEKYCLTAHQRTHSGVKPYSCEDCGAKFGYTSHLKRHMTIHEGSHTCKSCTVRFSNEASLVKHTRAHHPSSGSMPQTGEDTEFAADNIVIKVEIDEDYLEEST